MSFELVSYYFFSLWWLYFFRLSLWLETWNQQLLHFVSSTTDDKLIILVQNLKIPEMFTYLFGLNHATISEPIIYGQNWGYIRTWQLGRNHTDEVGNSTFQKEGNLLISTTIFCLSASSIPTSTLKWCSTHILPCSSSCI